MKRLVIGLMLIESVYATTLTLENFLEYAVQPKLIEKAIKEESFARKAKSLADSSEAPLNFENAFSRANSKALSGYEYEVGFSKEIKLGKIQALEQQQSQLETEAYALEQEKQLVNVSNYLKNLYHQHCLNRNYRERFQKSHENFVTLYQKKKKAYQHDEIAKTELLQLELEKNRLDSELEVFQQQLEDERSQLFNLAGFMDKGAVSCKDIYPIREQAVFDSSYMGLTKKAFQKRTQSRKVGLKRHSYKIDHIEVSMGYTKELETDLYRVGVSIPLNFSNNKSEHERASLMHELSALGFQNEQLLAQKKYAMNRLQNRLRRTFKSIESTQKSIESYKNSLLPLMKKSYDYGESSVIEYLLSQQKLTDLEQELLENKKGYYETLFQLYSMSETKEQR